MSHNSRIVISLLLLLIFTPNPEASSSSEYTEIRPDCWCRINKNNDFCVFDALKLNHTHFNFQPKALNVSNAINIKFNNNSVIPVLGEDLCNTFTSAIEKLDVNGLKIEQIRPNAFRRCIEIKVIRVIDNRVQRLPKVLFRNNRQLQELYLDYNHLQELDSEVFRGLGKLRILFLNNNQIKHLKPGLFDQLYGLRYLSINNNSLMDLPPALFKSNKQMNRLEINTNNLLDIDEDALLETLPNLKGIALNENEFNCVRVSEIKSRFKARGVTLYVGKSRVLRKRFYPTDEAESIMCASDISWMAAAYRHTITQPLKLENVCRRALTPNWVESMAADISELKLRMEQQEAYLYDVNLKLNITLKIIYTIQTWLLSR